LALRYKSLIVLVIVLFGQMLLMAYQLRRDQDVPLVRNSVVYVFSPIQRGINAVSRSIRGVWDGYIGLQGAHRDNQALTRELGELKLENQRLREQALQGRRLQTLFDLREHVAVPMVAAQVLSAGSSETARLVMIDKGADDGLRADQPVLVPDGVVGKVLHVFPQTAQVLLITDPYSGVASLLENSRAHGIVKGQNQPVCTMGYVPNGDTATPGERVFTSGEDQVFPKGLPVGVVVEAKPGPEFQQITVKPLAPLNRLEEVLVLLQSGGEITNFPITSNKAPENGHASAAPDAAGSVSEKKAHTVGTGAAPSRPQSPNAAAGPPATGTVPARQTPPAAGAPAVATPNAAAQPRPEPPATATVPSAAPSSTAAPAVVPQPREASVPPALPVSSDATGENPIAIPDPAPVPTPAEDPAQ
jgi:rod shape-determining protein MreC